MNKFKNRKSRIEFMTKNRGRRFVELLCVDMTDRELKQYFNLLYPLIKDLPDLESDVEAQCIRCGCDVEHHFECLCGYDRAVFSEEDWKRDIEDNSWSDLRGLDEEFIENGYKINKE